MSIRLQILTACLTLTVLTGGLGLFTLDGEQKLGQLALRMYDQAFMSVDFFRSAQNEFCNLGYAYKLGEPIEQLNADAAKVVDSLDVAISHATSPEARDLATVLRQHSNDMRAPLIDRATIGRIIAMIEPMFDVGAEQFAQDGFAFRLEAERVAANSEWMSKLAIGASLVAALLITASLTRSIVPPLRRATVIAREIARGKLDNNIGSSGSQELKHLLTALRSMQGALALREAAAQQVEHLAHHDLLTGLANRLAFSKQVASAAVDDAHETFALLLLDLDRFKPVNDTFGHAAGDELLSLVAKRITRCIAPADFAARIGGDEFAILHRAVDSVSSEETARRLIIALSRPFDLMNGTVTIGTSIGIKLWRGDHDLDELLRHADTALYAVKNGGRGGWRNYDDCSVRQFQAQDT